MRVRSIAAALGFAIFASGCVPMPPVALDATPADLEILAGEWTGEYESAALGRRGSIEFKLKGGTNEARGDVLMVPSGRRTPYQPQPYARGAISAQHASRRKFSPSTSFALPTDRLPAGSTAIGIPIATVLRTRRSTVTSRVESSRAHSRLRSIAGQAQPRAPGPRPRNARKPTQHGDSDV